MKQWWDIIKNAKVKWTPHKEYNSQIDYFSDVKKWYRAPQKTNSLRAPKTWK